MAAEAVNGVGGLIIGMGNYYVGAVTGGAITGRNQGLIMLLLVVTEGADGTMAIRAVDLLAAQTIVDNRGYSRQGAAVAG